MEKPLENSPYQLMVEGPDDRFFFGAIQAKMYEGKQIEGAFIRDMGGKYQRKKLKQILAGLALGPDPVKAIGIICDADDNPDAMFLSLRGVVESIGVLPVSSQIGVFQTGTNRQPRVGILVLPPDRPGIRETLCVEAVSRDPVMRACVADFMNCIVEKGNQPHAEDKARLLAYLAAQNDTDGRTGIAVERGYIPWESPVFEIVRQFLKDLTEPV